MENKIKILLADDTLIAREGWKRILETTNDIEVIGEVTFAIETFRKVAELRPDLLLMDLYWFGDDTAGWTTIKEIKKTCPDVKIIVIAAYENLIRDARVAGADSALLKTFTREELISEIREQACQTEETILPVADTKRSYGNLTDREIQVLNLMSEGLRDKEIGKLLGIASKTAKKHIKSIMGKLGARNRTQATSIARKLDLL